jgi:hypothetical protein
VRRVEIAIVPAGPYSTVRVPADLTAGQLAGTDCVVCGARLDFDGCDPDPVAHAVVGELPIGGDEEKPLYAHAGTAPVDVLFAACVARCEACGEADASVTQADRQCEACRVADSPDPGVGDQTPRCVLRAAGESTPDGYQWSESRVSEAGDVIGYWCRHRYAGVVAEAVRLGPERWVGHAYGVAVSEARGRSALDVIQALNASLTGGGR